MAYDLLDADRLADRQAEDGDTTTAQRAAADRTWAFGHVIVDEAQELSPMAWRMVMRRCPTRSMTLVGDVAQTGDPAGSTSWRRALQPHLQDRWRLERLTVNYRTPAEIMAVAADVLASIDPELELPRSVRESGAEPWRLRVPSADLAGRLPELVAAEAAEVGDGRLAMIVPTTRLDELAGAVAATVPGAAVGEDPDLTATVVVLTVRQAKGLEFDAVLVVDPDGILAEGSHGRNDLYVALTRATQRLGVVHTADVPVSLALLRPQDSPAAVTA
jgi:DNA helicase IV